MPAINPVPAASNGQTIPRSHSRSRRLTFSEWLDAQADRYERPGTVCGAFLAAEIRQLAIEARLADAHSPRDLLARREELERTACGLPPAQPME